MRKQQRKRQKAKTQGRLFFNVVISQRPQTHEQPKHASHDTNKGLYKAYYNNMRLLQQGKNILQRLHVYPIIKEQRTKKSEKLKSSLIVYTFIF